jgi:hypothetical protein
MRHFNGVSYSLYELRAAGRVQQLNAARVSNVIA